MIMMQPSQSAPARLPGFEHINHYWDHMHMCWTAKILPGELYVSREPDEMIATTLGSCVSACIRDVVSGIGGMNHFMLPLQGDKMKLSEFDKFTRYGNHAMEQLINEIIKHGGLRKNLEVKLVGGGRVLAEMSDIGQRNIEFVLDYVDIEKLLLTATDLGDDCARKVMYSPFSGRMRVKRLYSLSNDTLMVREQSYRNDLSTQSLDGDVELF